MTTYIMLANWTDQGVRKVKESPRRLDMAKSLLEEVGGEFKSFFLTMGEYDFVAVYEAPDDAVAARFVLGQPPFSDDAGQGVAGKLAVCIEVQQSLVIGVSE